MHKIKCRCGETEKSFKKDIGEFFINECCEKSGYDALGNKLEDENKLSGESIVEESEDAKEELSKAAELSNEEAQTKKEEANFDGMTAKALMELCRQRGISFSKRDTRVKLIEKLTR